MNKLWVIVKREYFTRVKSKGFVVATILTPLLLVSLLVLPALLTSKIGRTDYRMIALDQSGDTAIYERAAEQLTADNAGLDRFRIKREVVDENHLADRRRQLNSELSEGRLDAYIVIPASVLDEGKIFYHGKNIGDFIAERRVENAFNSAVIERRLVRSGIAVERIAGLNRRIVMEKFNEHGDGGASTRIISAFILMGILCLTILAYGSHVMSAVIEEKQSRIMEVLISSVGAFPLMLGKLIGVGLVGLTQYVVWAGSAVLLSSLAAGQALAFGLVRLPQIPVSLMASFVIYFLLGYFLYATLYAMLGSLVSNEDDGQQLQVPLMILILLAPVAANFVWRKPDLLLATLVSLFPFFSPFAMVLRIAIGEPPVWQIAASIFLMFATIVGAIWVAAKFYRVGALMYGKRPTLPEIVTWWRYS